MPVKRVARAGGLRAAAALVALAALAACTSWSDDDPADTAKRKPTPAPTPRSVRLPPRHVGFDYQIGGSYSPPAGVRIVSRDRTDAPAPGLYNICYVNAFQAQPDERDDWPAELLLRDRTGKVVVDGDWGEALLDIGTSAKRKRIADRINQWVDGCAAKGYDAVEPDNYDSYTRSRRLLTANDAASFIKLLSAHAHARGLAIAQKNTVELAGFRSRTGLDFAVAEECGEYDECGEYAKAFDDRVVVIEYTDNGLKKARSGFGDRLCIVRRDVLVSKPGSADYVRETR
ncbi:endo alpha-1,4 polygalactosaminidase [Streptomyces montanus]|uniref:Endo alpha-1,4 polygalactosaminidase n=1 Tax=Streptomyces montanus TaxID=2580423 RepID=A0A5R9FLP0_9ACTN|nr:endo alpha-1,4 polygalactosaminidase [Streptomyces montanus]TLS41773.1 endo alpha-1,4 polygalactosaminidase [Streptomyces montanus]